MLGLIHAEEENPERKINAADDTEIPAVPFEDAMNFLKSKGPMTKSEWLDLEPKLKFRAFTVAQLGSADVVNKAREILIKSFEKGGESYSGTWEQLKKVVNTNVLGIKPGYWENVFRTNTQSAYIAGKLQQYENTGVAAYQLLVIEDSRTSKICRHLLTSSGYGMIISVDHPFWKKYGFPPYHFQCRTSIRAVYPSEVGKRGNMVENPTMKSLSKFKVQEGFGGNPLERGNWWDLTDSMKRQAERYGIIKDFELTKIALGITDKEEIDDYFLEPNIKNFEEGDVLNRYMEKVEKEGNYFDVALHGTPTAVKYNGQLISARDLAKIIRHTKNFSRQNGVRLLSCSTGKGENCFAQNLANALGCNVKAPCDVLRVSPSGKLFVDGNAGWKVFAPNMNGRRK